MLVLTAASLDSLPRSTSFPFPFIDRVKAIDEDSPLAGSALKGLVFGVSGWEAGAGLPSSLAMPIDIISREVRVWFFIPRCLTFRVMIFFDSWRDDIGICQRSTKCIPHRRTTRIDPSVASVRFRRHFGSTLRMQFVFVLEKSGRRCWDIICSVNNNENWEGTSPCKQSSGY